MLICQYCQAKNAEGVEICTTCDSDLSADVVNGSLVQVPNADVRAAGGKGSKPTDRRPTKFDRDKFLVNQKRMSFKEKYYVYGDSDEELFYVERDFKLMGKRNITVFDDDSMQSAVLAIDQVHFWELGRREYELFDAEGTLIATFYRNNWTSMFRRGWDIFDPDGNLVAKAREDSLGLAAVRRIIDFVPFVELLGGIVKTDFHLFSVDSGGREEKIGSFDRRLSLFDKYILNLEDDPDRTLDRRVAVALGILLDTAERR